MAALAPVQGGALGGALQPALSYTSIMHMILVYDTTSVMQSIIFGII